MSVDLQTNSKECANWTFDYFLAKRFRRCELEEAYEVYVGSTKVREFKGVARSVGTYAIKELGTARRKDVTKYIEKALEIYDTVPSNGELLHYYFERAKF